MVVGSTGGLYMFKKPRKSFIINGFESKRTIGISLDFINSRATFCLMAMDFQGFFKSSYPKSKTVKITLKILTKTMAFTGKNTKNRMLNLESQCYPFKWSGWP